LKGSYIALFQPAGDSWAVNFPDISCPTCAEEFEDVVNHGEDALYTEVESLIKYGHSLPVARTFQELLQDEMVKQAISNGGVLKDLTWRRRNKHYAIAVYGIPKQLIKKCRDAGEGWKYAEDVMSDILYEHWKSRRNFDILPQPSTTAELLESKAGEGVYYGVFVPPSDEESCWNVLLPDFPDFASSGVDFEDSTVNASAALSCLMARLRKAGGKIPLASSYEDILKDEDVIVELQHGARIAPVEWRHVTVVSPLFVHIPGEALKSLNESAKVQGRDRNHLITDVLKQHFPYNVVAI
jgi:predicted RNase H-like HicB family nuclease